VNHNAPNGPAVISNGPLEAVGSVYSVNTCGNTAALGVAPTPTANADDTVSRASTAVARRGAHDDDPILT
jgi:hypothetical protein